MKTDIEIKEKTIFYDKANDVYTVILADKGGPIVSNEDLDAAVEKFDTAYRLSVAVKRLFEYK